MRRGAVEQRFHAAQRGALRRHDDVSLGASGLCRLPHPLPLLIASSIFPSCSLFYSQTTILYSNATPTPYKGQPEFTVSLLNLSKGRRCKHTLLFLFKYLKMLTNILLTVMFTMLVINRRLVSIQWSYCVVNTVSTPEDKALKVSRSCSVTSRMLWISMMSLRNKHLFLL